MNINALNAAVIAGMMKASKPAMNMVSAPVAARDRGIQVATTHQDQQGIFEGYIKVTVVTAERERSIAGTVFSDGKPRFIQIRGINIEAEIGAHMLYTRNRDVPGVIGMLGTILGDLGVNIANFTLGRNHPGDDAIALLYLDEKISPEAVSALKDSGKFLQVKPMHFEL